MTIKTPQVTREIPVDTLRRWHDELENIIYPRVKFDDDINVMRQRALIESQRIARNIMNELSLLNPE